MDTEAIKAARRETTGTKSARLLRKQDQMPAIIYARDGDPQAIALPAHDVEVAIGHGNHVLHIELEGESLQYLIRDVQYDYLGTTPVHLDLAQVNVDEVVEVSVPVELRGTPAGIHEGGVLDQVMNDIMIRCKVTDIPELIRPSVTKLKLNDSLHVSDLELPPGAEAVCDGTETVAVVRLLAVVEEAEEEAEDTEAAAEPEVISQKKKEDESEEDKD